MLSTTHAHVDVLAAGGVGQVVPISFQYFTTDQITVVTINALVETTLIQGVDFTVTTPVSPLPNLGTVTISKSLTAGHTIRVRRIVPLQQIIDFINQGPYTAASLAKGLDLVVMMLQQTAEGVVILGSFVLDPFGFVTKAGVDVITGAKTFTASTLFQIGINNTAPVIDSSGATGVGHMLIFKRHNDLFPSPLPIGWDIATHVNDQGAWYSNSWAVWSGALSGSPDAEGVYRPLHPDESFSSFMVGIRSDVIGPSLHLRSLGTGGANGTHIEGMDDSGTYTFRVHNDGAIWWGVGTRAQYDLRLYRTGALGSPTLNVNARFAVALGSSYAGRADFSSNISVATAILDGNLQSRIDVSSGTGPTVLQSFQPDGASVVLHRIRSSGAIANATARLLAIDNNTTEVNWFDKDGKLTKLAARQVLPTYSASITMDASLGDEQDITVTNNTNFTMQVPTNPTLGQRISVCIRNTAGGAMGTITWNAIFKLGAFTNPANGFSRTIDFRYNGSVWVEASRTPADVPN